MPTIHLRNPNQPLPGPNDYRNPSFYLFLPNQASTSTTEHGPMRAHSPRSTRTDKSTRSKKTIKTNEDEKEPTFRKAFDKFHSENGVRTLTGSIGPVGNVRMLLKNGYRHVYMSRKFAVKHGFVPKDASLGYYGYGGLVKYVPSLNLPLQSSLAEYVHRTLQHWLLANKIIHPQRPRRTRTVRSLDVTCRVSLGRTPFRRSLGSIVYGETTGMDQQRLLFCDADGLDAGEDESIGPDGRPVPGYQRDSGLRNSHPQRRKGTNRHRHIITPPRWLRPRVFSCFWLGPD